MVVAPTLLRMLLAQAVGGNAIGGEQRVGTEPLEACARTNGAARMARLVGEAHW